MANIVVNGQNRKVALYKYVGIRRNVVDEGQISLKERAEIIHGAHGRCQMCGKSVELHAITLVVDHKKPRDWGGTNDRDNLWAICEDNIAHQDNRGKRLRELSGPVTAWGFDATPAPRVSPF